MEPKVLISLGLLAIGALFSLHLSSSQANSSNSQFASFKQQFGKIYSSPEEEAYRLSIFNARLLRIEDHNSQNLSWKKGINQFSDMTFEEFESFFLLKETPNKSDFGTRHVNLPKAKKDWREEKVVTPVREQRTCKASWAVSAIGAMESAWAIKNKDKTPLTFSVQELIDCSKGHFDNDGCKGGRLDNSYDYIKSQQINLDSDYPFTAVDGACEAKTDVFYIRTGITSYTRLPRYDVEELVKMIDRQPVPVAFQVMADFLEYKSGIYKPELSYCGQALNAALLVVGYDTLVDKEAHFILKNSWGIRWGEEGFVRVMVGGGSGTCGIANMHDVIPNL